MSIRNELLHKVAIAVRQLRPQPITRVAIDGVDGAGKTTFADELAQTLANSDHEPSALLLIFFTTLDRSDIVSAGRLQ